MARTETDSAPAAGDRPPGEALQELVTGIARSMGAHEVHRFHELPDRSVLYVARSPDGGGGFTVATVAGDDAKLDFLKQLAESRPRRAMPPPYTEDDVAALEGAVGAPLPPLLRGYLTLVSRAWRPRPSRVGEERVVALAPRRVKAGTLSLACDPGADVAGVLGDAANDAESGVNASTLIELWPFRGDPSGGWPGAAAVVAGKGAGLALAAEEEDGRAQARLVPLWSVLFETFF